MQKLNPLDKSVHCKAHAKEGEIPCEEYDAWWACDVCNEKGLDPCKCGSPAAIFGEGLMYSVKCKSCDESIMYIGYDHDIKELWNSGKRGFID